MKKVMVWMVLVGITSAGVMAKTTLEVYDANGLTLFDGRNIMVGTELKLIVTSDANDFWSGGLFINGNNRDLAVLYGSGNDPNFRDYSDSHLEDAGAEALVTRWEDSVIEGFDLFSDSNCVPGDWFEIDYIASAPGDPNIGFYEYSISWGDPNEFFTIHQVPTADFNTDGIVNFLDYSLLASCWLEDDFSEPDVCCTVDLDSDGTVDVNDLLSFTDYWLWGAPEPNEPNEPDVIEPTPDPNLIYSIVDANGLDEITIDVGDTVTLYVDMNTIDANEVWNFHVEVVISDPSLGSIDNTAYDPNDPPGDGTARILASPDRWSMFDRWGPGLQQEEGIYLSGLCVGGAFEDGYLASFEFTCEGEGDVELSLINWSTDGTSGDELYPTLESILIHQNDPNSQSMRSSGAMSSSMLISLEPTRTPEEMVEFLEDLWLTTDEIQEVIDEKVWLEFIEAVKLGY